MFDQMLWPRRGGGDNKHCVHPSRQGSPVVTSHLERSLYLVPITQGNNVDVQHALRFDIGHSMTSIKGYEIL